MGKKLPNLILWRAALILVLSVAVSSALHAVITPPQDSPEISTPGVPQVQPPIHHMNRFQAPDNYDWQPGDLSADHLAALHLEPGFRHRLLYRTLRERANSMSTLATVIQSSPKPPSTTTLH